MRPNREPSVLIVGAGPAGLAAAHRLANAGVDGVLVVEREDALGGLPRFCRHPGFGWEYTGRMESGAGFARRLVARLDPERCRFLTRTTVLSIAPGPFVEILGPETGFARLQPKAVILSTGIRERPRTARLVPGERPERGVLTTGQLQQMVTRRLPLPGPGVVVVGTEHVSFSALLTARKAGLSVRAMVEPGARILSFPLAGWWARGFLGVPILLRTAIEEIIGRQTVEGLVLVGPRGRERVACEAVVFSGDFVPDAALARESGVEIDPRTQGPVIDQMMRTSVPGVFAAGNVLRDVETSGVAALEGARAAACVAWYLKQGPQDAEGTIPVEISDPIRYVVPQRWAPAAPEPTGAPRLRPSLRVNADVSGRRVVLRVDGRTVWRGRKRRLLRERRIPVALLPLQNLEGRDIPRSIEAAVSE